MTAKLLPPVGSATVPIAYSIDTYYTAMISCDQCRGR